MSTDVSTALKDDSPAPTTPTAANRPLWQLILGLAVIVGILYAMGGWAVPVVVFSILLMIVFHELGHFVTAKLTGMRATEFFVGFGPKLWSKQIGDTEFGVKAYLLGGYVRITGMTSLEEIDAADEPRSFRAATFPRRVLVASAGSLMHLLMAIVLAWASLAFYGAVTSSPVKIDSFTKWTGTALNEAQLAGLHQGDVVSAINGKILTDPSQFSDIIHRSVGKTLTFSVERHGQRINIVVTPVDGHSITVAGTNAPLTAPGQAAQGYIGVSTEGLAVRSTATLLGAVPRSFALIGRTIGLSVTGLVHIFSPSGLGGLANQVSNSRAASNPVNQQNRPISMFGIVTIAIHQADKNPSSLFLIFMLINIGIGLINMLPMLPLDGGHVAVAVYERLRTRRGQPQYHADVAKLMPVVYAFVGLLLLIFLSTLYLDIAHPINL